MTLASVGPADVADGTEPTIKRPAKPLTVLPSKGLSDETLGVELFLHLFLRWRHANGLPNIEPSRVVPAVQQGQVRRLDRRTAT